MPSHGAQGFRLLHVPAKGSSPPLPSTPLIFSSLPHSVSAFSSLLRILSLSLILSVSFLLSFSLSNLLMPCLSPLSLPLLKGKRNGSQDLLLVIIIEKFSAETDSNAVRRREGGENIKMHVHSLALQQMLA